MSSAQGGVGEAERRAAREVLDEQWRAGTLDPGEHERRVTLLRHATTPGDLDAALEGLPGRGGASGPVIAPYEGAPRVGSTGATVAEPDRGGAPSPGSGRTEGLIKIERKTAHTLVSLTPFLCLVLFFGFGAPWWIFFAIPIMPIVLYGSDGKADADTERRALRHEKKARRHQVIAERYRRKGGN